VLEADRASREKFSGHGSALAQAYNHMILPLASPRDRTTQVVWGIRDFERRFGRAPEGMWLPETAVDLATLEVLAELGIRFTILAPHQAARVRRIGESAWSDVGGGRIDPTRPYEQRLPSGRKIALFFYDAPIARAVAFEGLLSSGEHLVERLRGAFADHRHWPQLVHIATDGETYGHHHRFGDMALAYALATIEERGVARLTNYGEFLERHPPTHEVDIIENTSWSCVHGVERWRSDCGCNSGRIPGGNQAWRAPLRAALDWVRDTIAPLYERSAAALFADPWAARDDYIGVIHDRSGENLEAFFSRHAGRALSSAEQSAALKMLEMQRHALLMYASCAWFFDDLAGIETVQAMQYGARALQLAGELYGHRPEPEWLERLALARSNDPGVGDGRSVYEKLVEPTRVDWLRIGAHYAITSLFTGHADVASIYCYSVERDDYALHRAGRAQLAVGRARLRSEVTRDSRLVSFAALHLGDHLVSAAVAESVWEESYREFKEEVARPFTSADFPEVVRLMDRTFGESSYSLKSLFRDEQRAVLERILAERVETAELLYSQIYHDQAATIRFLTELQMPVPRPFQAAADVAVNSRLRRALSDGDVTNQQISELIEEARAAGVALDAATLEFAFRQNLERYAQSFASAPRQSERLNELNRRASLLPHLPFAVNLWQVQNIFYGILQTAYPEAAEASAAGDEGARVWLDAFATLGARLGVKVG
ncbi:MAG TPA: DUF3536 domain-containing protein, partial [Candidatus Eisenbacteria bacterium]|nr:DUF3536 domain-containing protein [Candidatus Eisenbacteria bacterium]